MPKPVNLTLKMLALLLIVFASSTTQGQDPQKAKMTPDGRGYLEYLPSGYSTSTSKYPAIIFLHGSGERGTGSAYDLEKVKRNGPPKYIAEGHNMCFTVNGKTECFVVLSPQTIDWSWKYDVIPFVKWAVANYNIDPDRVFVTGLSMGGEGAWLTAGLDDNNPNLLAGIAVMAGRGTLENGITTASRKINVWAFHGDADTALGIGGGLLPITGMLDANADPAPIWTVYPGVGHSGCWERAYRVDHMYHNPNVYEWFLTKRRNGSLVAAPAPTLAAPVANAGADKTITLPTTSTSFTASATDSDGQISAYAWAKISGPSATLTNTSTKTLSVSNAVSGTYVFRLTVKDNSNLQAVDDVQLTVNSSSTPNAAPTVDAGLNKTITLPSSSASFTATAKDIDGTIASYVWTKVSGGSVVMSNATTRTLSLTKAVAGTYSFKVTVTDDKGATASDIVNLVVTSTTSTNQPPVVTAGDKKYIYLPTNYASFTAVASDPDGSIVSYKWTKIGGGTITMSGTTTSTLSLSNAVECTYVFLVTVKDDKGATASAEVRLAVKPPLTTTARQSTVDATTSIAATTESNTSTVEPELDFYVGQNYPNPFTGKTSIPFTLSKGQHVILKIFNDKGNEVATLLDENLSAGEHVAELNRDKLSANSDAGVYYYKLLSEEKTITHRMIVGK
jgi:dienelactone hydrolase